MDLGIRGRTALVTAASRGFGRETALLLAREGARVALCARGEKDLHATAEEVRRIQGEAAPELGDGVLARALDVADPQAISDLVAETRETLGPVDLLLVNAGGPPAGTFADLEPRAWDDAYRLTLGSALSLCREVLPEMVSNGWGRIVAVTSVSVKQPVENLVLSSVIRPAVQALVRCLADEAGPNGVTINSVAPGFHSTSAVERLIDRKMEEEGCSREDVLQGWTEAIPLGRLGNPEELASLIVFLMSRQAGYITGQCIVSDGGWVKGTF